MIKNFTSFNEAYKPGKENIYKHIVFRDHDLQHWLQFEDGDYQLKGSASNKNIEDVVDVVLETFENYGEDETPGYVILNKEIIRKELIALAKVFLTLDNQCCSQVLTAYASDYIKAGEKWQQSDKLKSSNDKTGIFEA